MLFVECAVSQSDFLAFTSEKKEMTSEKIALTSEKSGVTSEKDVMEEKVS
jgi:hypothetical protein